MVKSPRKSAKWACRRATPISPCGYQVIFSTFEGDFLTNHTANQERRKNHWRNFKNPVEKLPRNSRFLSPVVVECVLTREFFGPISGLNFERWLSWVWIFLGPLGLEGIAAKHLTPEFGPQIRGSKIRRIRPQIWVPQRHKNPSVERHPWQKVLRTIRNLAGISAPTRNI